MKICVIICEFNPFHNGHAYLISRAKEVSDCDAAACVMSGAFTQRGEICALDPYTRARHAVLGGADAVFALPTHFSVAPAEIFARGAVKIAAAIPNACALVFGCESGSAADFMRAAEILVGEDGKFKRILNERLDDGESYIRSLCAAFSECGGDKNLLSSPNNILGVEYAKAILRSGAALKLVPVKRAGAGYSDTTLGDGFSSAAAIRANPTSPLVKKNMPPYAYTDFAAAKACGEKFRAFEEYALIAADKADLKRVYGCGEGLENKLKEVAADGYEGIISECTGKRYTASRISRILCANALKLYADDAEEIYAAQPILKPLAVKNGIADGIFAAAADCGTAVLTRERQTADFSAAQKKCLEAELFCYRAASALYGKKLYYYTFARVDGAKNV